MVFYSPDHICGPMNNTQPGHLIFQQHLAKGEHILPVGLMALMSVSSQQLSISVSALHGARHVFAAMAERLKNPHNLDKNVLANTLCAIGLILNDRQMAELVEEMDDFGKKTGPEFAASYQAIGVEPIPTDRQEHMQNFLSSYSHALYSVATDWSVSRIREMVGNSLAQIDKILSVMPVPHSEARSNEIVQRLDLPAEMQPLANRLIQVTALGLVAHGETTATNHEEHFGQYFESFYAGNLYRSSLDGMSGGIWAAALSYLVAGNDIDRGLVRRALSSKGWFSSRGFFGTHRSTADIESVMGDEQTPWRTICEAAPGDDFCAALFHDTFKADANDPPALVEFMPKPENFLHLGRDLDLLRSLISSDFPMRVLLVGQEGSGRRALLHVIAQELGRTKVRPKQAARSISIVPTLSQAQISGHLVPGGLLVLDEIVMPDEKDAGVVVGGLREMKRSLHEAWLVNSLDGIHESLISLFDLVVHIPTMPLADRIQMAERLMGTEIAEKVAQAATLPGEIASMAQWAKRVGVNDWNALSGCLLGVQRARMAQRKENGSLPVQLYPPGSSQHGFEAVIGEERNVARAKELSEALKSPDAYKKMGISPPKGLLLLGPPGTGKTHLARAMAREAGVNLLLADAAALAESPEAIHSVFNEARKQAPCILFIDEIDAIAAATEKRAPDPKRQSILNRLLTELDGFETLDGVLVIGATHRSDLLDAAVTRAGRLGHSIVFKRPERVQREALWKHYMRNMPLADNIDWHRVGRSSTGMSPADIAQGANEAGLRAVRAGSTQIQTRHILSAIEEMLWGEYEDNMPLAEIERWRTAVHESGHAMLGWHHRIEIDRACVRPQGFALGFVRWLPEEGRHSQLQGDLAAQLNMFFGGLAAETVILGAHGTGSGNDLMRIRSMVASAVRSEGMHEKFPAGIFSTPFEPAPSMALSEEAEKVESELMKGAHQQALTWLRAHKDTLELLAKELMEKRELDGPEVQAFLDEKIGEGGRAAPERTHLTLVQAARFQKGDLA